MASRICSAEAKGCVWEDVIVVLRGLISNGYFQAKRH
jgi:hypothetical protein